MSTQLIRGPNKDDLFERELQTSGQLPSQTFAFEDVEEHILVALVEKRVSHNQAYRFKVLETIFTFFETKRNQLLEAAAQDFNAKAARAELELEYSFTLSQIAAALQSQCKPLAPSGPLPDRFFSKLSVAGSAGGTDAHLSVTKPMGAVLVVAQPKRPFDDLFAPMVSAVAAGNVVCAVLTPTMPSLNKVIVEQLTPELPKSVIFVINPADMAVLQHGVADLHASEPDVFGVKIPGTSHVATRINVPGSAFVSASLATAPSRTYSLHLGGNDSKVAAEKLKDVATEVVEGASLLLGRGVGAPKYLFVHEEVYGRMREALLLAIGTSTTILAPRNDGSQITDILQNEQTIGSKVAVSGGAARLLKAFPSEKRPGPVALIEVDVEAARASKLSAVISDRKVVEQVKDLGVLILVGVSSTEHAFGLIEELGLDQGHMVVYSNDSAEVQHVMREVETATLSINHVAPENLFSSYAPKPQQTSATPHYHLQRSKPSGEELGLRWPLELFQKSSSTYLAAVRKTSVGLSGISTSSNAARSALSSSPLNRRPLAVRKALALHLAKTKRLARRSRPTVTAPILRVFFLQGLFLFWGSALMCTLGGLGVGVFKLSRWAWMRYMST